MRKLLYISLTVLLISAVAFLMKTSANTNGKSDSIMAYNIMVNAEKEKRALTSDEKKQIERKVKTLIAFDDTMTEKEKDAERALSAMYMNFYETQVGDYHPHFDKAKSLYEELTNGAN